MYCCCSPEEDVKVPYCFFSLFGLPIGSLVVPICGNPKKELLRGLWVGPFRSRGFKMGLGFAGFGA